MVAPPSTTAVSVRVAQRALHCANGRWILGRHAHKALTVSKQQATVAVVEINWMMLGRRIHLSTSASVAKLLGATFTATGLPQSSHGGALLGCLFELRLHKCLQRCVTWQREVLDL